MPAQGTIHVPGKGLLQSDPIVVPNDPALLGCIILQQMIVFEQSWFMSDVVGAMVRS